jgi:hypothetical protein
MDLAGLRFVHAGRFVRYCQTLEELGLHDGDQIHVLRFRAGLKDMDLATAGPWQACAAEGIKQKSAADLGSYIEFVCLFVYTIPCTPLAS